MSSIRRFASSTAAPSFDPMLTVPTTPSSDTDTSAPVSDVIVLMTLPFGPITSPILSIGISKLMIFGAVSRTSARGSAIAASITSRIFMRASRAWSSACASTSAGRPSILVSSCSAVTKSRVPATLKSMSPKASSVPRMSVSVVYLPSAYTRPIAMPATGARSGTPPSIIDSVEPHTDAIEVEPFELRTSETMRST